jgi:hypothetical protein
LEVERRPRHECPGAVIGGERIVYINGFYCGMLDAARRSPDANRFTHALQWRTTAMGVQSCDGGSNYFGAEYLADVDTIRNLLFDGAATIAPRSIDPAAIPGRTAMLARLRSLLDSTFS